MSSDGTSSAGGSLRWLWLSVLVLALDQASKQVASAALTLHEPLPVLPFFNLTLMHNEGAAFSLLAGAGGWQRWLFVLLAVGVSVGIVLWLRSPDSRGRRWLCLALALVLGGALGNLVDRLALGYVVDFIQVFYHPYYWPAFNLADSAISVGAVLLVLDALRGEPRRG